MTGLQEYAAAFFLLGGALKDAVNVCIRQLGDFQLAIALARVIEQSSEGPVLQGILKGTVLPIAFQTGNRWLGSWAFWLLHRRDLAVRILLVCRFDIRHVVFMNDHFSRLLYLILRQLITSLLMKLENLITMIQALHCYSLS